MLLYAEPLPRAWRHAASASFAPGSGPGIHRYCVVLTSRPPVRPALRSPLRACPPRRAAAPTAAPRSCRPLPRLAQLRSLRNEPIRLRGDRNTRTRWYHMALALLRPETPPRAQSRSAASSRRHLHAMLHRLLTPRTPSSRHPIHDAHVTHRVTLQRGLRIVDLL